MHGRDAYLALVFAAMVANYEFDHVSAGLFACYFKICSAFRSFVKCPENTHIKNRNGRYVALAGGCEQCQLAITVEIMGAWQRL